MESSPIRPGWILEGAPLARKKLVWTSADGTASTVIWDCTAGRFNWYYRADETVCVLEGSVVLKLSTGVTRTVTAGETIYFPAGSSAEWTVDAYIKKIAFFRAPLPRPLAFARRLAVRLKHTVKRGNAPRGPIADI